jgi:hypothetical protein
MKDFQSILKDKINYYGFTEAAIDFAVDEYVEDVKREYRLELLEEIKLGFDICSDTSAFCLGYRNLVDRIRREKENNPIDKSISPIKPYKNE